MHHQSSRLAWLCAQSHVHLANQSATSHMCQSGFSERSSRQGGQCTSVRGARTRTHQAPSHTRPYFCNPLSVSQISPWPKRLLRFGGIKGELLVEYATIKTHLECHWNLKRSKVCNQFNCLDNAPLQGMPVWLTIETFNRERRFAIGCLKTEPAYTE